MRDFKNIKAYQLADDQVVKVYAATQNFPKEERYGLISQLRRAAVSVPTNITEGASRKHKKDYLHFLYIARGSCAEVNYLLHLSKRLEYIDSKNYIELDALNKEAARTLFGLISSVEKETNIMSKSLAVITSGFAFAFFKVFGLQSSVSSL